VSAFAATALARCCALPSGTVLLPVIAGPGCVFVARPYKIKICHTTSTEQCARIATDSDKLPSPADQIRAFHAIPSRRGPTAIVPPRKESFAQVNPAAPSLPFSLQVRCFAYRGCL
jgi:hypothetical protein